MPPSSSHDPGLLVITDLTEPELTSYRSSQVRPDDFETFWANSIEQARRQDGTVRAEPVESGLVTIDVFDVTFPGFAGDPIRAWLRVPRGLGGSLPTIVQFVGYGGGRGRPWDNLFWASAGWAHVVVDSRGQGAGWSVGDTGDPQGSSGPQGGGVMTRGIEHRDSYYYRRLIVDAVRSIDALSSLPHVDPRRVAVLGSSQGGGVALAVAALVPEVAALATMTPFLCDFPRAVLLTDDLPYKEIGRYLAIHRDRYASVLQTLAYFDGVNFAAMAGQPAYFSAALMDQVTPPSTIFGAFHAYAGHKRMTVWPFNGHESGGSDEDALILGFLRQHLAIDGEDVSCG